MLWYRLFQVFATLAAACMGVILLHNHMMCADDLTEDLWLSFVASAVLGLACLGIYALTRPGRPDARSAPDTLER